MHKRKDERVSKLQTFSYPTPSILKSNFRRLNGGAMR